MTRKGWRQVDVPHGRSQSSGQKFLSSLVSLGILVCQQPPAPRGSQKPTPEERVRRTPDDNRAAALAKNARIQASIQVLGMEGTEELQILKGVTEEGRERRKKSSPTGPDRPCARLHQESTEEVGECRRQDWEGRAGVAFRRRSWT